MQHGHTLCYLLTRAYGESSYQSVRLPHRIFTMILVPRRAKESSTTRWQLNNSDAGSIALVFRPLVETFSPRVQSAYGDLDPRDTITNNLDGHIKELIRKKWQPLHTTLYAWKKSGLVNNLLSCLGDRVEMAHSVEARTPFLDHHLTEYVNAIPPSLKVRCDNHGTGAEGYTVNGINGSNGQKAAESSVLTEKWILREATQPFITDEIFRRQKHPYTAPVTYPTNGPLHKLFQRTLTNKNVERLGFLSWDAINSCIEQAFPASGKPEVSSHTLRAVFMGTQWVILSQKFGVKSGPPKQPLRLEGCNCSIPSNPT
jgi:asparagine synthase (glutamine-hydrolysing)